MNPQPKPRPHALEKADRRAKQDRAAIATRSEVRNRDGFKCRACKKRCVDVHHLKLRSRGGTNETSNLVSLCRLCHAKRHAGELTIVGDDANRTLIFRGRAASVRYQRRT